MKLNEYFRFMWVSVYNIFQNKDDFCEPCLEKTTFHIPNLRTGEGHAFHNKIRIEPFRGNSSQAHLSEVAVNRD